MIVGVRHAPVALSMEGRCYGALDVETRLTPEEAAGQAFDAFMSLEEGLGRFETVWTSDLSRCQRLACALSQRLPGIPPVRVDERLRELDHGSFEGRKWDEIHESEAVALERWGSRWRREGPPGGESAEDVQRRVGQWCEGIGSDGRHLLVGHAGVMRALLVLQQGVDWTVAMSTPVPHLKPMLLA